MSKKLLILVLCGFSLMGCASGKKVPQIPTISIGEQAQIYPNLGFKVISYKFLPIDENSGLPKEKTINTKYLAVLLEFQHLGAHRGIKPIQVSQLISRIELNNSQLSSPLNLKLDKLSLSMNHSKSLNKLSSAEPIDLTKKIEATEIVRVWSTRKIHKDLVPPFTLTPQSSTNNPGFQKVAVLVE